MKLKKIKLLLAVPLFLLLACSYSVSGSSYTLSEEIVINIPVANNKSRYGSLGPLLSQNVVKRLSSNEKITISENANKSLILTIEKAVVSGGAWQIKDNSREAIGSSSRVMEVTVEAVYEITETDGLKKPLKVQKFTTQRNYLVSSNQSVVDMREREVLEYIVQDLSQKIALTMFSDF